MFFDESKRVWLREPSSPAYVRLSFSALRKLNATHLFTEGNPRLSLEEGLLLREIDRVDKHPLNGTPLSKQRILYRIEYCDTKNRNDK